MFFEFFLGIEMELEKRNVFDVILIFFKLEYIEDYLCFFKRFY